MQYRAPICGLALLTVAIAAIAPARAFDQSKFPDWSGQWRRAESGVVKYDPSKPERAQEAPLTPEYQAIFETNLRDRERGPSIDPTDGCLSPGMPRIMNVYEPMEIVITPDTTHILIQHVHDERRIYTDGRDFPSDQDPMFAGYSIGKWIDVDNDGRYDELEIETRNLRNPRTYDATGIPFHDDGMTVIKERIYRDSADPNILYDQITTVDHALTRPWTVIKKYLRAPNAQPTWSETVCAESNDRRVIAKQLYKMSSDGYLMPVKENQAPPDLKYFKQSRPQ